MSGLGDRAALVGRIMELEAANERLTEIAAGRESEIYSQDHRIMELLQDLIVAQRQLDQVESTLAAVLRAQRYTQARCTALVEELRAQKEHVR